MRVAGKGAIKSSPNRIGYRFPKIARLRKKKEFSLVRQSGEIYTSKSFTLRYLKRVENLSSKIPHEIVRLGISFYPRTKSSVVRNRAKRVLREIFRIEKSSFIPAIDLHIGVKPQNKSNAIVFSVWKEEFIIGCKNLNIWRER